MSNVKQIYTILNDVAKQTFGTSTINVVDTASFVSLGNTVLKSDTDTENFLNIHPNPCEQRVEGRFLFTNSRPHLII